MCSKASYRVKTTDSLDYRDWVGVILNTRLPLPFEYGRRVKKNILAFVVNYLCYSSFDT